MQPMTPLDLVKAARKAYGESTDVGSALDLWGGDTDTDGGSVVSVHTLASFMETKHFL